MQKYLDRMITEKKELDARITRAENTVASEPYGMTNTGKELLLRQIIAMKDYSKILSERIEYEGAK